MEPDQSSEEERDDSIEQDPARVRGISNIEVKNDFHHAFDQKKAGEHERE